MAETAKWYVVHTYSGYENKVAQNLEKTVQNRKLHDLIVDIKVLTDDSWYVVRNTRGVTGFVGPTSKPIPLTEEEVAKLGVETRQVEVDYAEGDNVKIVGGPLEGFIGRVEKIDLQNNLVSVIVSMFGRETPVELELDQAQLVTQ